MSLWCIVCHVIELKDLASWNMSRPKIRKPAGHNNHAKLFLELHAIHAVKVHIHSSSIVCLICYTLIFGSAHLFLSTDDAFINPQLAKIFDRVRQSADFMPTKQMMV